MKRILALSLMVVLVFSMGVFAQVKDYDIGSLKSGADIDIGVEFAVTIDEYARAWVVENKLFDNSLLGKPGLYTSDENQVIELANNYFASKLTGFYWKDVRWMGANTPMDEEAGQDEGYDTKGGALFRIESNCDATVNVELEMDDGLESELVLWVFRHQNMAPYPKFPPVVDGNADASRISTKSIAPIKFSHLYANQREKLAGEAIEYKYSEYKIGGALFIDYIGQQEAAEYKGTVTITVSAAL